MKSHHTVYIDMLQFKLSRTSVIDIFESQTIF